MKYYTQQDLCKELNEPQQTISDVSIRFNLGLVATKDRLYTQQEFDRLYFYFTQVRNEAKLRLHALLIENYKGIKVRDVYRILRRDGMDKVVISRAILAITTQDPLVWEELPTKPPEYDPEWFNGDLTQTEIQEKMDEMDYMESILCYGYNWWYQEHPEDDPNTREEKNGK